MAADRVPTDFGARLRLAREGRGVSLRAIADATKISVRALESLERNDISQLPGGIFSRAFVRAYAVEVGLDPEETIADFLNAFPDDSVVQGHPRTRHQTIDAFDRSDARTVVSAARVVAAGVAVTAVALYFGLAGRRSTVGEVEPVAEAAAAPVSPPAESASAPLAVVIEAQAPCTLTTSIDGAPFASQGLQRGARVELRATRELLLSASDPAALQWTINGAAARPLTGPVRVTPGNATAFLTR